MRIGLVTACYKPVVNGVTRMVSLYKDHLEEAGHEVTVFTLGTSAVGDREQGVVRSPALPLGRTGYHFSTRYSRSAQAELNQMDLLHCHHILMGLELAHRYSRCPLVFTNHTRYDIYLSVYSPLSLSAGEMVMRRVWPAITEFADAVIAPSKSIHEMLLAMGVRKPVELIVNGIDLEPFHAQAALRKAEPLSSPRQEIRIIYVGRLSPEKNVIALVREFHRAYRVDNRLHLTIVGDGPQRKKLEQLANAFGIRSNITFRGKIGVSLVPRELAAADIFATRSISEVHPLTIIESMAVGLPIAATMSPGVSDIVVDGLSGLLGPDKEGALAQSLLALASDPRRAKQMGLAAFRASSRFKIQNTVVKTQELYQRLLAERPDRERRSKRWQDRTRKRFSLWQANLPHSLRTRSNSGQ